MLKIIRTLNSLIIKLIIILFFSLIFDEQCIQAEETKDIENKVYYDFYNLNFLEVERIFSEVLNKNIISIDSLDYYVTSKQDNISIEAGFQNILNLLNLKIIDSENIIRIYKSDSKKYLNKPLGKLLFAEDIDLVSLDICDLSIENVIKGVSLTLGDKYNIPVNISEFPKEKIAFRIIDVNYNHALQIVNERPSSTKKCGKRKGAIYGSNRKKFLYKEDEGWIDTEYTNEFEENENPGNQKGVFRINNTNQEYLWNGSWSRKDNN